MSLENYITIDDIDNRVFKRLNDTSKQAYVDEANDELEDLAKRQGVDPADISLPIHVKLVRYAVLYALSRAGEDNTDFNNSDGYSAGDDVYEKLFKRSRYLIQNIKLDITPVMFTGDVETIDNRAVTSQRIVFG